MKTRICRVAVIAAACILGLTVTGLTTGQLLSLAEDPRQGDAGAGLLAPMSPLTTVTLYAVADAYVYEGSPNASYGSGANVIVGLDEFGYRHQSLFRLLGGRHGHVRAGSGDHGHVLAGLL